MSYSAKKLLDQLISKVEQVQNEQVVENDPLLSASDLLNRYKNQPDQTELFEKYQSYVLKKSLNELTSKQVCDPHSYPSNFAENAEKGNEAVGDEVNKDVLHKDSKDKSSTKKGSKKEQDKDKDKDKDDKNKEDDKEDKKDSKSKDHKDKEEKTKEKETKKTSKDKDKDKEPVKRDIEKELSYKKEDIKNLFYSHFPKYLNSNFRFKIGELAYLKWHDEMCLVIINYASQKLLVSSDSDFDENYDSNDQDKSSHMDRRNVWLFDVNEDIYLDADNHNLYSKVNQIKPISLKISQFNYSFINHNVNTNVQTKDKNTLRYYFVPVYYVSFPGYKKRCSRLFRFWVQEKDLIKFKTVRFVVNNPAKETSTSGGSKKDRDKEDKKDSKSKDHKDKDKDEKTKEKEYGMTRSHREREKKEDKEKEEKTSGRTKRDRGKDHSSKEKETKKTSKETKEEKSGGKKGSKKEQDKDKEKDDKNKEDDKEDKKKSDTSVIINRVRGDKLWNKRTVVPVNEYVYDVIHNVYNPDLISGKYISSGEFFNNSTPWVVPNKIKKVVVKEHKQIITNKADLKGKIKYRKSIYVIIQNFKFLLLMMSKLANPANFGNESESSQGSSNSGGKEDKKGENEIVQMRVESLNMIRYLESFSNSTSHNYYKFNEMYLNNFYWLDILVAWVDNHFLNSCCFSRAEYTQLQSLRKLYNRPLSQLLCFEYLCRILSFDVFYVNFLSKIEKNNKIYTAYVPIIQLLLYYMAFVADEYTNNSLYGIKSI